PASAIPSIGAAVRLPIFDGGRLRGALAQRNAEYDAAVEHYNQTLADALREVVDQLTSLRSVNAQRTEVESALASAEEAYALAVTRYKAGLGSLLQVLTAEMAVLEQRNLYTDLHSRELALSINLMRALYADDTDYVQSGQRLIELDKADARVALEQAEAQLAKTVRSVRTLRATSTEGEANVVMRRAELRKAEQDLARRRSIESSGAVSGEELQHAIDAVSSARATLEAARKQLEAQRAQVDRTDVHDHPDVKNAAARVREALLACSRTDLPAPMGGFVARRSVQVGQRVAPGNVLMTVVPLEQVWVDANFKENQLANLRPGQPVTLVADAY